MILPVTKASGVVWNNTNGAVESDNGLKAAEAVECDGVPVQKKMSPKKATLSVSTLIVCILHIIVDFFII